jgi:hypothetical protein
MSEGARWVPKLRFPEFRGAKAWKACAGSDLFHQVNERNAQADLPVLAITQEHGAIPRELIDYHVSVTDSRREELLHQGLLVGLEGGEFQGRGDDDLIDGGEEVGDTLLLL